MFPWNLFPNNKQQQMPDWMKYLNQSGLEKQMEQLLSMLSPEQFGNLMKQGLSSGTAQEADREEEPRNVIQPAIFETHDYVFVRMPIKEEELPSLKLYHTNNRVILSGLPPNTQESLTYPLPCLVKKKGAKSSYKDGILEIILFKIPDTQYSEISVPEW